MVCPQFWVCVFVSTDWVELGISKRSNSRGLVTLSIIAQAWSPAQLFRNRTFSRLDWVGMRQTKRGIEILLCSIHSLLVLRGVEETHCPLSTEERCVILRREGGQDWGLEDGPCPMLGDIKQKYCSYWGYDGLLSPPHLSGSEKDSSSSSITTFLWTSFQYKYFPPPSSRGVDHKGRGHNGVMTVRHLLQSLLSTRYCGFI